MRRHDVSALPLLGRVLLAFLFLMSGVSKFTGFDASVAYAASQNVPSPEAAIAVAGAVEVVGALALLVGVFTRAAAWLLLLFLIPVTLIFHDFWTLTGPERPQQMVQFMKNLAIMGGLIYVANFGAGRVSIDAQRRAEHTPAPQRTALGGPHDVTA